MIDQTWGNAGRTVAFVPGNGFSAGAYRHLIDPLAQNYKVHGLKLRPLCEGAAPTRDWRDLARDVGAFIDRHFSAPVIGVGHSIGAVALLLSGAERPTRYTQLVLLDPVALRPWIATLLQYAPAAIRQRGPRAKSTAKRPNRWANKDEAYARERKRRHYARVSDDVLKQIVESGLVPHPEDGYMLRFSREWESRLYESPANIWGVLRRALPPVTVIRGEDSDLLSESAFKRWRRRCPQHRFIEVPDSGHLVPFEKPAFVAELVQSEIERMCAGQAA